MRTLAVDLFGVVAVRAEKLKPVLREALLAEPLVHAIGSAAAIVSPQLASMLGSVIVDVVKLEKFDPGFTATTAATTIGFENLLFEFVVFSLVLFSQSLSAGVTGLAGSGRARTAAVWAEIRSASRVSPLLLRDETSLTQSFIAPVSGTAAGSAAPREPPFFVASIVLCVALRAAYGFAFT